ncbi:PucR family transcriptional regulator [Amycolatopsis suaedae]|uniref:PucR family transcriptional regulator n=1 Tax=Amycolatopsis suaedae TaxID=2510978 RepID=A0A4Q7JD19_9PSEU|nr:helix-turn-helix domain-containing protein [Amycolatopsis suaedae]RZQ65800.1 PucR family transcriptional regulator [Amycolatopsis suaedae]
MEGKFHDVLVGCTTMAIETCFDAICDPHSLRADWKSVFRYGGRVEFHEGRTMDAMQAAIRIGARVVWRRLNTVGRHMGINPEILFTTAEAIFAWVDEVSTTAVEGYLEAQAEAAGATELHRRRLLAAILAEQGVSAPALADLASAAEWDLPARVTVIAFRQPEGEPPSGLSLGGRVLVDLDSAEPCLVAPEPDADLDEITRRLGGVRAAVGPTVALADAHRSRARARRALALAQRGLLPDDPVIRCADHLPTLVLFADDFLAAHLAKHVLAPFDTLPAKQRDRLVTTLRVWLETRGGVTEVGRRLGLHPQTVRYRMNQISELVGDRLTDPDERLLAEMVLRTR